MAESRLSPQVEEDDHEEGEISDEEPPAPSPVSEEHVESFSRAEEDESTAKPAVAASVDPSSSSDRDPPLPTRGSLDDLRELGGELKAVEVRKPSDFYRARGELESNSEGDGAKRNGRGTEEKPWQRRDVPGNAAYGSNLYNFAWAQAVSGVPNFSPKESTSAATSSKQTPGSQGLGGTWSSEEKRKLSSREFNTRDMDFYRRPERSEDGMSPTRENGSSGSGRAERVTDGGWGGRMREAKWVERPVPVVKSRIGTVDTEIVERDEKGEFHADDDGSRKQRSESQTSNGRLDEVDNGGRSSSEATVQAGQNGGEPLDAEEREEGELEEGEIELGSSERPASPSQDYSRQSKYNGSKDYWVKENGNKAGDYWGKDKTYTRPVSSKSVSRSQIEDFSSRRQRQIKALEAQREKRLAFASDLVKNVTVKDAQKSFVDVCGRLHKALRVLDELLTPRASSQVEDGRVESLPRDVSALARQSFAGIRAVYAVRNTASGREQERDKNVFPSLLELANGFRQKLFTPKQNRELEVMMQTIATAGRFVRDGAEKGQYPREHQLQPAPKKSRENDVKQGDVIGDSAGNVKQSNSAEPKSSTDTSVAGRGILSFVDSKQADEAAAIAAAALAYAQSSDALRANSMFGYSSGQIGTPVSSLGSWGWLAENPTQVQFTDSGFSSLPPGHPYHPPSMGKYPTSEHRSIKLGQDGYAGHIVEGRPFDSQAIDPTTPKGTKVQEVINVSPGYSKPATTYGMLEDDWEELSPPGAGMSSYAPLPETSGVQTVGTKDETSIGKAWALRSDTGTVSFYQNGIGATTLYSVEQMPSPTHPQSRGTAAPLYAVDRLPSPTPDEDDDVPVAPRVPVIETKPAPRLPQMDTKPVLLEADTVKSATLLPLQRVGKLPLPTVLTGSISHLIRSQSLDTPLSHMEPNAKESSADIMLLPSSSRIADDIEALKVVTLPPKGNFRSRDPRRRLQNHSLDMTDMFGMNLNSQLSAVPNLNLDEAHNAGNYRNRKRLAPDIDDVQDVGPEKRQKAQAEITVEANDFTKASIQLSGGFINGNIQLSGGTGGWLDDNAVPSFGTEEGPIAMEVDDNGPSPGLEDSKPVIDLKTNGEERSDTLPEFLNNVGSSQNQKLELGQVTAETGQRKMKPRDPRRVLLETNVERGDYSSREVTDGDGIVTTRKGDVGSSIIAMSEAANWNKVENNQLPNQGSSLLNIGPHFMEKLTSLAGIVSSTSVAGSPPHNQLLAQAGSAHAGVDVRATEVSAGSVPSDVEATRLVEVASVTGESIPQGLPPEHLNDKPTTVNTGPRKPKGSPSQWGASQVHPDLEQLLEDLTEEQRRSVQLERKRRMEEQDRMFSEGKLCLVLDLDHTLLNSAKFSEIEPEWEMRLRAAESAERSRTNREALERRELYRFPHMSMWTKLRPGIWKFLARASQLYELHVYTMGNKVYATEMAKLLDPTGKLFAGRVISKGDDGDGDDLLPKSKDLDGVLGMESAVLIIDDSARVWPHHSHNLIVVERYMYFPCSRRQFGLTGPSLLEVGHDERESDGMLASALGVVDKIHKSFFQNLRLREIDVREILAAQQRQVLAGCKVVFSRVFPVGEAEPQRHPLWRTAEQFGAICTIAIDEQVTHVVAISLGTDKVNWALETGRYVVRPAWLEASTILYRRANERDFPVHPK